MLKRIVLGLICLFVGTIIIYFSGELSKVLGRWNWAESVFGSTKQGYNAVGVILILFGFLYLFGVLS